ncbi:MAG: ABC transporter permease [Anaerolineales bacterium]|nr:ABC transporter permease [Anaerolineales bacterium]
MFRYIVRRLLQAIPTLLGVSILSYLLVLAAPGDPIDMMIGFDPKSTPETKAVMREQLGLDQPALVQYLTWMTGVVVRRGDQVARLTTPSNRCGYAPAIDVTVCDNGGGILRGNLGVSYKTKQPVWERLVERMPATIELGLVSLILSLIIGIPLGVLSAVYRGGPFDYAVRFMTVIFTSIPIFWFALLLILVFAVTLGWLPSGGRESVTLTQQFNLWDRIQHLILPAIVLAVGGVTAFSRLMRTETLEVLNTDYIRTARARDFPTTPCGSCMRFAIH